MTDKILIDRELLEVFVRLLQSHNDQGDDSRPVFAINDALITLGDLRKLRAAIVAPQQEAVAWYCDAHGYTDNKDDAESWRDRGMPVTEYYLHPAPSVPEGWQPISTAPKDGTKLLLCVEANEQVIALEAKVRELEEERDRAVRDTKETCARLLELRPDDVRLMAGEVTAQEVRTIMAVLSCLRVRMRSNDLAKPPGAALCDRSA